MGSSQNADIDGSRLEWHPHDKDSLLGEGAFGSVYRGTLDITEVAIKVIKRSTNNSLLSEPAKQAQDAAIKQLERELRRLDNLRHPHIVQFLGAVVDSNTSQTLIVTELLSGGSLHDALEVMRNYGPKGDGGAILDERSFLRIGSGIASGLLYLHNSKYTHGDMKPHNVLLNSTVEITDGGTRAIFPRDVNAKIADFGLSRSIGVKNDDLMITTNTQDYGAGPVGTFAYMAPQAFDGIAKMSGEIAKAADIYAFAIVMYELLCGRQPWVAENVKSVWMLCRYVCSDERRPSWGPREASIRAEYIEFVKRCWAQKWQDRPNSEEVAKQFRMWTQDFKSRASNTSLSVADASGSSQTGSPSVLDKEESGNPAESPVSKVTEVNDDFDMGDLGTDENGAPLLQHVESGVLDEREALDAIKHHVFVAGESTDPQDWGNSTDTRDDSSTHIPPAPPEEEYDDPGASGSIPGSSVGVSGEKSVDIMDTAGFNGFVKRVETQNVCLPEVEKLDLLGPAHVVSGADPGSSHNASQNAPPPTNPGLPGLGLDALKIDSANSNKTTRTSMDSFVGAANAYNDNAEGAGAAVAHSDPSSASEPSASEMGFQTNSQFAPPSQGPGPAQGLPPNPVVAPVLTQPQPPVHPQFIPPANSVSPPLQPMPSNPGMIYPNGPPYSGYGQTMPTLHTSSMSTATLWHSGNVPGGQHAANVMNGSSPPMYGGAVSGVSPQLSVSAVIDAIRAPGATTALDQYWTDGHAAAVAMAFAQGATQKPAALSGKAHLNLVLDLVARNNAAGENPAIPKDTVSRDLCVAIGAMAMNASNPIDRPTAAAALPIALSTMQSNHNNVSVYWSCCFAMSNLLKVSNHIEDAALRKDVAVWIVHAISWNLSRGSKLDALAYMTSSAARNYMWLNEANTAMFLSKEEKIFNASPLRKLLTSLSYFRQQDQALEASLSALAMIAYFPAHRPGVIANQGVKMLLDILRHCVQRPHAACLCLSILNVLVSDPGSSEERAPTRAVLLGDNAVDAVIAALFYATDQQLRGRNPGLLQIEEEALAALTALCEYDEEVLAAAVKGGAVRYVGEALRGFAVLHVTLIHSSLLTSCAVQMCEAAYALAKNADGLAGLRETEALKFLKTIKTLFRENEQLVSSAAKVISILSG